MQLSFGTLELSQRMKRESTGGREIQVQHFFKENVACQKNTPICR